ncbi:uncharacterized protein Z520_06772 [Fonsecaea multimorphosa CBS 102226]|uniref:Uncharacterized protein n=1 Tax=Fonsecaea multimorphosa CBS 102226 TaxID=1442371 RepID=A0A0D2H649_9EURO|nr:uncharacterized protein Z520_06772 [Fonsecaea multimorphosa CBS 102226]KIX97320.1 hypothetical protein Z520_06772 [Fonsecaea multimorphosa CBS 102226]OAL23288.1 hypothetical protein AYO22_06338 [Fonsecaea multimorphosa]
MDLAADQRPTPMLISHEDKCYDALQQGRQNLTNLCDKLVERANYFNTSSVKTWKSILPHDDEVPKYYGDEVDDISDCEMSMSTPSSSSDKATRSSARGSKRTPPTSDEAVDGGGDNNEEQQPREPKRPKMRGNKLDGTVLLPEGPLETLAPTPVAHKEALNSVTSGNISGSTTTDVKFVG